MFRVPVRPSSGLLQPRERHVQGRRSLSALAARTTESRVWPGLLLLFSLPHSCHPSALPGCGLAQGLSPTRWPDPFTKPGHRPRGLPWTGPSHGTGPGGRGSGRNPGQEVLSPEDGALWPAALGEGVRAMCSYRNNTGLRIRRHGSDSQFCHSTRREPTDKLSHLPRAPCPHWSNGDSAFCPPT